MFCLFFWGGQTAVTAMLNCTHCSPTSTSDSWGGVQTAVTAKLNCTHCSPTSTSDSGGGLDCSHWQSFQFCIFSIEMKYLMHSLLIKKSDSVIQGGLPCGRSTVKWVKPVTHYIYQDATCFSGGVRTAVTAKLNCTHCSPTSTSDSGGGLDCSCCTVGLHSLQINFTAVIFRGEGVVDCIWGMDAPQTFCACPSNICA